MHIEDRSVQDLTQDPNNARGHDAKNVEAIVQSLEAFGQQKPIIIDKEGKVVAGNGTLQAAKQLGWKSIKAVVTRLEGANQSAYAIADNRTAELAHWNDEQLAETLAALENDDSIDAAITGFSSKDIDKMIESLADSGEIEEDEIPEDVDPVTKPGDLYLLGDHRLLCGDSTKTEDVDRLMDGMKADMVFTDPPYGVSYEGGHNKKKRGQIQNDSLHGESLTGLFADSIARAIDVSEDHAAFYVWFASGKSVETFAAFADLSLDLRAVIQWYKVRSGLGAFMAQYIPNCEPCIYAFKSGCTPQWFGASDEKTVWELQKESSNDYHPTQKPVDLPRRALRNSTKKGQIVLDLFGGSGSTLIACEHDGRNARLMEIDPAYCDVIVKRWENLTGEKAERISAGG